MGSFKGFPAGNSWEFLGILVPNSDKNIPEILQVAYDCSEIADDSSCGTWDN